MNHQVSGTSSELGRPEGLSLEGTPLPLSPLWVPVPFFLVMGVLFAAFASMDLREGSFGMCTLLTGGVLLVVFALHVPYLVEALVRFRFTVELYARGFTVRRGHTVQAISYAELETLWLVEHALLRNGSHLGWLRTVRVSSQGHKADFRVFVPEGGRDPGAELISRLLSQAEDAMAKRLAAGGTLRGAGWTLDAEGLRPRPGAPVVALSDLSKAGKELGHVLLWRGNEESPFLSVLEGGPNAHLLLALARRHLLEQGRPPEPEPAEADGSSLGRVLFEKRKDKAGAGCIVLLGLLAVLVGTLFLFNPELRPVGGFLFVGGALWGFLGARFLASHVQCHERGLVQRTLFGSRTLFYRDIHRCRFIGIRDYEDGLYVNTSNVMLFFPREGPPISFDTEGYGNDTAMEFLRDKVARIVADRLYRQLLGGGEPVRWSDSARLGNAALLIDMHDQEPQRTLAYSEELRFSIEKGDFSLFVPGEPKPVLTLSCAGENFYPGLVLFQQLCSGAKRVGPRDSQGVSQT